MKRYLNVLMRKSRAVKAFLYVLVAVMVLFAGERVEAAATPTVRISGYFESDGVNVPYYYTDVVNRVNYKYKNNDVYLKLSHPVYVCFGRQADGNFCLYFISDSVPSGNWISDDGTLFENVTWYEGNSGGIKYYYYNYTFKNREFDLTYANVNNTGTMSANFVSYYLSDKFNDLVTVPPILDFNSALDASWVWIEDFRADLEEDIIYMTWGEFKSTLIAAVEDLKTYENRYIGFAAIFVDERFDEDESYNDMIVTDVIFEEYESYEGSITFEDFGVPDGYRLWYLHAYPFWFWDDDTEGNLQKGKSSMITFDADGKSNNALIKDSNDIYNPIDPDFSNWNAITNFTGNYFNNMQQTFDNTFQNYDASGMDDNTDKLNGGLKRYQDSQDSIISGVNANIEQFNPGDYLNFTDSVLVAMGLTSGWINQFLGVSADFTTVFIIGCLMVFVFVVIGIWRFQG